MSSDDCFPPQCKSFRKIEIRKKHRYKNKPKTFCPKSPHPHDDVTGIWSDIARRGIPSDMKSIADTSRRKKENRKREHVREFKRLLSVFLLQTESSIPVLPHQADFSPESCSKDKKQKAKEIFRSITGEFWLKAQSSKRRTEEADWFFCFRAAAALSDGSTLLMIGGRGFNSLWRHKHTARGQEDRPIVISNMSELLTICRETSKYLSTHLVTSVPVRVYSRTHGESQSASGCTR